MRDSDRLYLRFNRDPSFLRAIDWTFPVPHEGNHEPAGLVVHDDLISSVAAPDFGSRDLPYFVFADQARFHDRDMRGLVFEWLRISPLDRVPKFIRFYETYRDDHYLRFRTYYEPAKLMYVHCMDLPPCASDYAEDMRARARENILVQERSKYARLKTSSELQKQTLERIEIAVERRRDSDLAGIPVMSLPLTAGLIKEGKIIENKNTRGRDRTRQLVDHLDVLTTDQVARSKPWSSKRPIREEDVDDRGHYPPSYSARGLNATMMRTRVRELDEHCDGARASKKRSKRIPMVETEGLTVPHNEVLSEASMHVSPVRRPSRPRTVKPRRPMTQDEIEEDDGKYENCYL